MENSNLHFYENLHRKYFNKAKHKSPKSNTLYEDNDEDEVNSKS